MGPADYVIQLPDAMYDVGLYRDAKKKGLVARTDLFLNSVGKVLGATARAGESAEQAALGKLYQMYGIHAATRKAVQQGNTVNRINGADGSVRLVIGGFK